MNKALLYDKQQKRIKEKENMAAANPSYKGDDELKTDTKSDEKQIHRNEKSSVTKL